MVDAERDARAAPPRLRAPAAPPRSSPRRPHGRKRVWRRARFRRGSCARAREAGRPRFHPVGLRVQSRTSDGRACSRGWFFHPVKWKKVASGQLLTNASHRSLSPSPRVQRRTPADDVGTIDWSGSARCSLHASPFKNTRSTRSHRKSPSSRSRRDSMRSRCGNAGSAS